MKVVINAKFGGFSLSRAAAEKLRDLGHPLAIADFSERTEWAKRDDRYVPGGWMDGCWLTDIPRDDAALIALIEEMGVAANGSHASLKVVEIPDGVSWEIEEYDGNEHIAEVHRTWS